MDELTKRQRKEQKLLRSEIDRSAREFNGTAEALREYERASPIGEPVVGKVKTPLSGLRKITDAQRRAGEDFLEAYSAAFQSVLRSGGLEERVDMIGCSPSGISPSRLDAIEKLRRCQEAVRAYEYEILVDFLCHEVSMVKLSAKFGIHRDVIKDRIECALQVLAEKFGYAQPPEKPQIGHRAR